jgi:lipopolysaccharide/colanic/teichoic acid biosynthesis glycosyltransferase
MGAVEKFENAELALADALPGFPKDSHGWASAHWTSPVPSITWHSGLALTWDGVAPRAGSFEGKQLQLAIKRVFDVMASFAALVALAPLLVIVAVAVKLTSRGPVFFRQYREGLNGSQFIIFKFRSLSVDREDRTGVAQTRVNDPRVTPIGRFIRRTSIDELPQLLNVLLGDMSLVGPRPHVSNMNAGGRKYHELVPYYAQRLQMRPGLTGWAQCNGLRGSTEEEGVARARVDHDIAYVQNFSLALDFRILVSTVAREFLSGTGH